MAVCIEICLPGDFKRELGGRLTFLARQHQCFISYDEVSASLEVEGSSEGDKTITSRLLEDGETLLNDWTVRWSSMTVMLPQTERPNNTITYRRRSWLLSLSGKYGGLETIAWEMANMTLFDLVEPEVTHKVPKHWHSFPPPHPLWHPVLGTLYVIIGLFALFGNGVVLWVFCCTRSLRSGTNLLVINLAFSDLCMVISQFPILVCNCFSQAWVIGPFVCELYGFCGALFGTMSIINLAVIAYDRYRAILSPFGGTQLSMRRAGLWLLLIWVYSGGWCALPFFGWNHCTFDYLSMDTWSRSYVVVLFLASYAVPLVVVCYAYFGIVSSVSRHDRNLKSHERAQGENVRYQNLQRRESQLNRFVYTSVLAFMIASTPYAG
ncbi:hypothetical protein Pcinc_000431 [Petrolisthes cinctipes]|uniref:G-protein coupled receptors family 1 profile domain-containing protein n=1 Tax=Petrolisthes cinctipes TaxID=88211 RepID=A0AAE1GN76_PETCI|nr:hypothetical protein Pcinc_000431 [Petrolisthes cinctipes]